MSDASIPKPPRPGAAVALVSAALRTRRALDLRYGGAWRRVHPHAVGRSARGRLALLAWQVADERGPERAAGWRLFDLDRLEALEPGRERFRPHGGVGPRSPIARPIAAAWGGFEPGVSAWLADAGAPRAPFPGA